jgi:hypothetical protein
VSVALEWPDEEEWGHIEGFAGYEISTSGRVKSKRKILKPYKDGRGYLRVDLGRGNKRKVHRLVAQQFIENPENLPIVNHINGDRHNNHINNLEWVTGSGNLSHAWKRGSYSNRGKEKI